MTDLSPAALAVLDAYMTSWLDGPLEKDYRCAASVLRAAADLVVPEEEERAFSQEDSLLRLQRCATRHKLLAIAAELEGTNG